MVTHSCNTITWETEAGTVQVSSPSLVYVKRLSKKEEEEECERGKGVGGAGKECKQMPIVKL